MVEARVQGVEPRDIMSTEEGIRSLGPESHSNQGHSFSPCREIYYICSAGFQNCYGTLTAVLSSSFSFRIKVSYD